jgi:uncharacterized protein DUF5684
LDNALTLIWLAIAVIGIIAGWKIFTKAGQPGWAVLIPIYNAIVLMRVIGRPWWWIFGFIVPILNIVVGIVVSLDLAKSFGRGTGFGIGLWLLPFIFGLILGFGSDTYRGPRGEDGGTLATADPNAAW